MPQRDTVKRFSRWERVQHAAVIVLFVLLFLTGLPQKFSDLGFSRQVVDALGGIFRLRWIHRAMGLVFTALVAAHLAVAVFGVLARRVQPSLFVTRQDFTDAIRNLRYYLGYAATPARYGRFSYGQKFEYWGMIFGSLIMIASGVFLLFPIALSHLLPAELIPVARVVHSNEAMLALLIVLVWHMYSAHLSPEVFPMDTSIFTGEISRERQREEHPLERRDG